MAIDIINASGGDPDSPHDATITAQFLTLQSALLAARRLQWAMEGLAENSPFPVTASIALYPAEGEPSESAAAALRSAAPGRVLIPDRLAEAVRQLPGLTLGELSGAGWRELGWRSPGEAANYTADEQSVLGLIRALGREDPLAIAGAQLASSPVPAVATASYQGPTGLGRSVLESETASQPIWKKPWAIVSAGAVALVIIAVLILRAMAPAPHPQAATPEPSPKTPAPVTSSSTTVPAAPEKPPASKPSAKAAKQPRTETTPAPKTEAQTEPPKPPPPPSSCNLTEAEIPLSLQRAARLMSAGKLVEAQDAYQRLVGCPSAREQAAEGLRQVKQRMGFQGTPN